MTASISFDEIDREVRRASAYVELVRTAQRTIWGLVEVLWGLRLISKQINGLVNRLYPKLDKFSDKQIADLTKDLSELHGMMVDFSRNGATWLSRVPLSGFVLRRYRESAEEIGDLLEDLLLSQEPAFKELVSVAVSNLGLPAERAGASRG